MKNCIIFSGQYRTFGKTKENIKQFIALNDLDVYCHLWSVDESEINDIIENLQPKKILVEDFDCYKPYFESIESSIRFTNPKPSTMDILSNHASMNFGRKQALDLIEEEYDNFIYCRYDIDFFNVFKIISLSDVISVPFEESYNLISDIFCISPFKYAKHYFLFDHFQKIHSSDFEEGFLYYLDKIKQYGSENVRIHREERYCPHMLLLRNLYNNGVPFNLYNFPVRLYK